MDLSRRNFVGSLVAAAALPSLAADDPSVFPARGRYERLALAYQHIHLGLDKPFSVLHISDTHLTAAYPDENEKKQKLREARTRTFGGRQEEALRDSLAWAKDHVDYVVHTGDLIDWQSRANYDLVKKYFGPAAKTLVATMGNHEFSPDMWLSPAKEEESFKDRSRKALAETYPFDIQLQSTVVNGVNFVAIDDVYATVPAVVVERFHAEVKKGLPIVLCMHVPFHTPEIWRASCTFWRNQKFANAAVPDPVGDYAAQQKDPVTRDFIAYLKGEKLLKGILAGHLHITVQERFSPTAMQYVVGSNFLFHGQQVFFT